MIGTDTDDDPPMGGDSMELAPHGEKDEILSDDGSKSAAVERFGFLQEDHQIIQDLIAGVRRALKRKSITPQQICGLGKLLHGLERLPRPTSGLEITVTIGVRGPEQFFYRSIELYGSSFALSSGGSEYTPGVGSDTYTSFSFSVEVGGYREDTEVTEINEWMSDFIESLCDEDQDFEIHDGNEGLVLDWHEEAPGDDWDQLDSAY